MLWGFLVANSWLRGTDMQPRKQNDTEKGLAVAGKPAILLACSAFGPTTATLCA